MAKAERRREDSSVKNETEATPATRAAEANHLAGGTGPTAPDGPAEQVVRKPRHFANFDGLRAIAAVSVLLLHTAWVSGFTVRASLGAYTSRLEIGVSVFFLITQAWSICTEISFYLFPPLYAAVVGIRRLAQARQLVVELVGIAALFAI